MSKNNKNKIVELFGIYCSPDANLSLALANNICPYTHEKCKKMRKSEADTLIGTCSVRHQNKEIIICPHRLIENDQIFLDCRHLLRLDEPGNEWYIIPEVSIPGGYIDYFLVSAKNQKVVDFVGIELQTMDTNGTVWPERQRLLKNYGFEVSNEDVQSSKTFGMNWKMTAKTILVQMLHEAETFEAWGKHLVLVIQRPFYDYLCKTFKFNHFDSNPKSGHTVHIHAYDFNFENNKMKLDLNTRVSTDAKGVAECLGLKADAHVEIDQMIKTLESRLSDEYRISLSGAWNKS